MADLVDIRDTLRIGWSGKYQITDHDKGYG
jgi:hypothetical protein